MAWLGVTGNGVRRSSPGLGAAPTRLLSGPRRIIYRQGTTRSLTPTDARQSLSDVRTAKQASAGAGTHSTPYTEAVEVLRQREYPHMNHGVYLDHSGTTIYARSTVEAFASKMMSNLYGNPHSANDPAKVSGDMVDQIREKTLRFLGADPRYFDLVFVANATAAIKLVADSFRDLAERTWSGFFWYGYHKDSHTSLVGVRELAAGAAGTGGREDGGHARCFVSDREVESWLAGDDLGYGAPRPGIVGRRAPRTTGGLGLFAYPGQSNMSGRRLPLSWPRKLRGASAGGGGRAGLHANTYSFLDAAALAMTSPMGRVFSDPDAAPDFTALSFYKIFGFPDLGGLVVRKDSGHILTLRKYFGGGTVTMVAAVGRAWHVSKSHHQAGVRGASTDAVSATEYSIHDGLEDGTLPFHSILALGEAIDVHKRLYGSMENVSRHTTRLAARLYREVSSLRHESGMPVCHVYGDEDGSRPAFGDASRQGPTLAFNVIRPDGTYVPYSEVEQLANSKGIYIRSGGVCCPGGLFTALGYEPWELERARSAGHHCGPTGISLVNQLPTGVVRASLGVMSTDGDVDALVQFLAGAFATQERVTAKHHQQIADRRDRVHAAPSSFG